jgi:amino acid transporter
MSYLEDATKRAQRRKSPWNGLLFTIGVLCWAFTWYGVVSVLDLIHQASFPGQKLTLSSKAVGAVLVGIGPLVALIPVAMLIANAVVRRIPAASRALDAEAVGHQRASYREGQRDLRRFLLFVTVPGVAIGILGALISWSQ